MPIWTPPTHPPPPSLSPLTPLLFYWYVCFCSLCKGGTSFWTELNCRKLWGSYLCLWLTLFHSLSHVFFLYWSLSISLCALFHASSSNIDEVHLINLSPSVFVFGHLNILHKDWLTYFDGTNRTRRFCYKFSISRYLIEMFNYPTCYLWLWLTQSCSLAFIICYSFYSGFHSMGKF